MKSEPYVYTRDTYVYNMFLMVKHGTVLATGTSLNKITIDGIHIN